MKVVWIGVAGALGAVSRYALGGFVSDRTTGAFPWGTFSVNVSGSFALALVFTLLTERYLPHPHVRTALTVGFLGAYTTYSTYALESVRLAEDGALALAALNVIATVVAAVVAVYAGIWLGRAL